MTLETQSTPPISPESGAQGDIHMAADAVDKITERWSLTEQPATEHPFFLIVGGVQGSGKSSMLHELSQTTNFVTVSPDEIRWIMFGENYFLTPETGIIWRDTVHLARNMLINKAMERGYSVALDQSMNPDRLIYLEEEAKKFPQYQTKKILLNPPNEVLRDRVKKRPRSFTKYNGNPQELEGTMHNPGVRDASLYDLTIDSSKQTSQQIAAEIRNVLGQS